MLHPFQLQTLINWYLDKHVIKFIKVQKNREFAPSPLRITYQRRNSKGFTFITSIIKVFIKASVYL